MRKTITDRTVDRLIRACYDNEELAARLRAEGYDSQANSMQDVNRILRSVANSIGDRLQKELRS